MKVWTDSIRRVKIALVVTAVAIAVVSLVVSHILVRDLQREEVERMEVWAEAMRSLINADENTDLNLVLKVINGNHSIPLMVVDETGAVTIHRNIPFADFSTEDSIQQVENFLHRMQREGGKMEVSSLLKRKPEPQRPRVLKFGMKIPSFCVVWHGSPLCSLVWWDSLSSLLFLLFFLRNVQNRARCG